MAHRKIINTKLEILQCSMDLFLEKGYTSAYITTIIKGSDVTIVFDMGNGITWSVNGKNITSCNGYVSVS